MSFDYYCSLFLSSGVVGWYAVWLAYADPERFARGGPTLTTTFFFIFFI